MSVVWISGFITAVTTMVVAYGIGYVFIVKVREAIREELLSIFIPTGGRHDGENGET